MTQNIYDDPHFFAANPALDEEKERPMIFILSARKA